MVKIKAVMKINQLNVGLMQIKRIQILKAIKNLFQHQI